jgi:hypothetical protein
MADDSNVEVRFSAKTDDFEEGVGRAKAAIQDYAALIKDVTAQLVQMGGSGKDAMAKISASAAGGDAERVAMEAAQGQIQAANLVYQNEIIKLNAALAMHQMTEAEKTAATVAAVDQRERAEMLALAEASNQKGLTAAQWQRLENEETDFELKADNDRLKAEEQAAQKYAQEWKAAADQVASAFNSQLKGLLAGTTSWSKAMKNISADLVLKFIQDQIKATTEALANKAREVATTVTAESAKTTAATAGAAARSAAETASGETSILQTIANAIKSIFASAGQTAAAVSADVAPEAGPAAPAIGLAAGGAIASSAMGLVGTASFDVGTDYVLRSGLAMVHQGEQIKPAVGSGPYTGKNDGGGGGGGGDTHVGVHISALDSRSIERFFNDNAKHMIRAINKGIKGGAHLGLPGARA